MTKLNCELASRMAVTCPYTTSVLWDFLSSQKTPPGISTLAEAVAVQHGGDRCADFKGHRAYVCLSMGLRPASQLVFDVIQAMMHAGVPDKTLIPRGEVASKVRIKYLPHQQVLAKHWALCPEARHTIPGLPTGYVGRRSALKDARKCLS